jgi:hypothetical protein
LWELKRRDVCLIFKFDADAVGHPIQVVEMSATQNNVQDFPITEPSLPQHAHVGLNQKPGKFCELFHKL